MILDITRKTSDLTETGTESLKRKEEKHKNGPVIQKFDAFSENEDINTSKHRTKESSETENTQKYLRGDLDRVAKDQASKTVTSWLHQNRLVDEYFVNVQSLSQNEYSSVNLKTPQEEIEIGLNGYVLEGNEDLMKKKIKEFKAVTARRRNNAEIEIQKVEHKLFPRKQFDNIKEYSPEVQLAVNARVNLDSVLNDVEYFQTIPETCDRLHNELAIVGNDWACVKEIVHDHIGMQSFLVELTLQWMKRENFVNAEKFLKTKINLVRELGHSLISKLLYSIGAMFSNGESENIKYVVNAIKLYETEFDKLGEFDLEQKIRAKAIMIKGVRKIAIQCILEDCENRSHEIFRSHQGEAADSSTSITAEQMAFAATFNACAKLTNSISIVQRDLIPIFPKTWGIFPNWAACIGSICSQYILQQIGSGEGNNLSLLLPNQLLKLLAWMEEFRSACDFPSNFDLTSHVNYKPEFISSEELRTGKGINHPQDSLTIVLAVLWDIHRNFKDQFMLATQTQTNIWLENLYEADHSKNQTKEGRLETSLPEDLWTFTRVQLTTVQEQFVTKSDVFFHTVCIIFRCIQTKCRSCWKSLNQDAEMCCAAANDALRMIHLAEIEVERIKLDADVTKEQSDNLEVVIDQLTTQFLQAAVASASSVYSYIFEPIEEVLVNCMFDAEWEEATNNDMAMTIVQTLEDYLKDLENWLEKSMLRKALDALVKMTINFYVKHLLKKSIRRQKHTFNNTDRAIQRISGDINVLKHFFQCWVVKFPALERVLEYEFELLYILLELLKIGYSKSENQNPVDLFPLLYKRVGNLETTRFLCCQLWHILSFEDGLAMRKLFHSFQKHLSFEISATFFSIDLHPELSLNYVIQECRDSMKKRSRIKTMAKKATKRIIKKTGKLGKKAVKVIY